MKNIPTILALVALLFAGCATTNQQPRTIREEIAFWSETGAMVALMKSPESRKQIAAAVAYLESVESDNGPFTIDTLRATLSKLEELQSTDAKLAIIGGTAVLRRYAGGDLSLATPEQLKDAALGLRDGLKNALGPP